MRFLQRVLGRKRVRKRVMVSHNLPKHLFHLWIMNWRNYNGDRKEKCQGKQISPHERKKPKWEKFSIFKHLDIPGTEHFSDEIQAKIVFGS